MTPPHRIHRYAPPKIMRGGERNLKIGLIFVAYGPLTYQNPCRIIVYSVANYRPHTVRKFNRDSTYYFLILTYQKFSSPQSPEDM